MQEFENKSPQEILRWALATYHPKIALASSFGAEDVVCIDMMMKINRLPAPTMPPARRRSTSLMPRGSSVTTVGSMTIIRTPKGSSLTTFATPSRTF